MGTNGLSTNGLGTNGLGTNGLSTNGLNAPAFQAWFEEDPAQRDTVMEYVAVCAIPSGQSLTYTSPGTGLTYTWAGLFGLAPDWSNGSPASVREQQVVSACLAAHTNKYGQNIPISVLGRSALGLDIPYTGEELREFSEHEACFFGNLFTHEGIYAAADQNELDPQESTARGCGLSSISPNTECAPLVQVGRCVNYCSRESAKKHYRTCTYNGVAYQPITTRIRNMDIYRCGDGVCQFTEQCGTGDQYNNCLLDCGPCL